MQNNRRKRYTRNYPRTSGRNKNKKQDFVSKVISQIIICVIILVIVVGIKSIDTPFTNKITSKISETLTKSTDFKNAYETVEVFTNKIGKKTKNILNESKEKDETEETKETLETENEKIIDTNTRNEKVIDSKTTSPEEEEKILSIEDLDKNPETTDAPEIEDMCAPVDGIISSGFGMRKHPLYEKEMFHSGIDIEAPENTDIICPLSGVVLETGSSNTYGNYIKIQHNEKLVTFYAHCSEVFVSKGIEVNKEDIIGKVGITGSSSGAHLHFEVIYDGKYVDPLKYIDLPLSSTESSTDIKI